MKAKTNSRLLPSLLSGVLILSGIMVMGNVAKASEEENWIFRRVLQLL